MTSIINGRKTALSRSMRVGTSIAAIALLAACGGNGDRARTTPSPQPTPTPSPAPTPSPTPTPTPTPTASFNTSEFRRSEGPAFHNAVAAWSQGIDGNGVTIGIIDTGIDEDSPEFAGRIHPDSASVSGTGTVQQEDDHGTNVALVAAAARDNTGVLGIAYNATILAIRGDTPGSCAEEDPEDTSLGCTFTDRNIAAGVDLAIRAGAKVLNLSLGGSRPTVTLQNAIRRAADAGIVIIVSAGNDGDSTEDGIDPDNPDPFAAGLLSAGGDNVIIVGSVNDQGVISGFSNRAGNLASSYITARGERICCVYDEGELFITERDGDRFITLFSGTSFSAPQVAGAAALLAQAFPNLSAEEIVEILLDSAREAGTLGTDAIYGRGILDIEQALAPAGTTGLAGTETQLALADDTAIGSPAMGDALSGQSIDTVITDKYDRAYSLDIGGARLRGAAVSERLHASLEPSRLRRIGGGSGPVSMAFSIDNSVQAQGQGWARQLRMTQDDAQAARVLASRIALQLDPKTQAGFTVGEGSSGLMAQLQGHHRPAFLIAGTARGDLGFSSKTDASAAFRKQLGPWGITASADTGEAWLGNARQGDLLADRQREQRSISSFSLAADRRFGDFTGVVSATLLQEDETILGGYFHEAFGARGADTLFIDAAMRYDFALNWQIGGDFRYGRTSAVKTGLVSSGSNFSSNAWSADLMRANVMQTGDRMGIRISQPLRVSAGGLNLNLPVSYDYATESAGFGIRSVSLAPSGREMIGEMSWQGNVAGGNATAALFYRHNPGHYAQQPADAGVAVRWGTQF